MRRVAAVAGLLLVAACGGGAIPRPTDAHVSRAQHRWPSSTRVSLERGRDLYVARCSGCHPLHAPTEYPAARWHAVIEEMAPRARLDRQGQELVLRYVVTMAER